MSADQFADILKSRAKLRAHVRTLVRLAAKYHLAGLDLDYESINFGSTQGPGRGSSPLPQVRQQPAQPLAATRGGCCRSPWLLAPGPPIRTGGSTTTRALGEAADRLRIMTYDYHWSGGQPGPMAPKSWVREVLNYATDVVSPSKISFGLPAYGRDWFKKSIQGKCPASAHASMSGTTQSMRSSGREKGCTPDGGAQVEPAERSPIVQQLRSDGRPLQGKARGLVRRRTSVARKLSLVEKFQIRGVAMWALGYESSATWDKAARLWKPVRIT